MASTVLPLGSTSVKVQRGLARGTVAIRCDITTDASGDMSAVTLPAVFGRLVGVSYAPHPYAQTQTSIVTVLAAGGTFTLTRGAVTTAAIAYNATAATVLAALVAANGMIVPSTVTRETVTGGYAYTLKWSSDSLTNGKGNYSALTSDASSLTGGANTATVTGSASTDFTALATGADTTIADSTTGAPILTVTNGGTSDVHYRPTMGTNTVAGVAISADTSNNDLNRDIYVAGKLTVTVAQGGNVARGSLLLTIDEGSKV